MLTNLGIHSIWSGGQQGLVDTSEKLNPAVDFCEDGAIWPPWQRPSENLDVRPPHLYGGTMLKDMPIPD